MAPAEIASALRERGAGADVARMNVGARVGATAVIEASRAADSAVVAAWLLEREQRFDLDAKTLVPMIADGEKCAASRNTLRVVSPMRVRTPVRVTSS